MPRKAKRTLSGERPQPVSPVAGQMYGAGVEQAALQQAMPMPAIQPAGDGKAVPTDPNLGAAVATGRAIGTGAGMAGPPAGPGTGGGGGGPGARVMSDQERYQAMMQAAQAMKGRAGLLKAGTGRPNEPVTAGLSTGPGGGPEMMQMQFGSATGNTLRRLSQVTGDPYFRNLAAKAGM